ncbi:MAG TPA: cytochrome c maturation protein CcmE [Pseudomonadales bacterium]
MHPVRKQRLVIVLMIVTGASLAVALTAYALRQNINAFYTPTQIQSGEAAVGQRLRVGGLVVEGSVERAGEGLMVSFELSDNLSTVSVDYEGILPDLFREGQGILANGELVAPGRVKATEVLAKHDENYMSPEVKAALEQAGHVEKGG